MTLTQIHKGLMESWNCIWTCAEIKNIASIYPDYIRQNAEGYYRFFFFGHLLCSAERVILVFRPSELLLALIWTRVTGCLWRICLDDISITFPSTPINDDDSFDFYTENIHNLSWKNKAQQPQLYVNDTHMDCLRPATLFKKRLWHRRFPINFMKFLRTPFYRTPLDDCFYQ